jgi:hypothetical protein
MGDMNNAMAKHNIATSITSAARELVKRHGATAVEVAQQRVSTFSVDGFSPEHDRSLLLLSAVEKLLIKPDNGEVD